MKFIIATHGHLADGYASSIKVLTNKDNVYVINAYADEVIDVREQLEALIRSFNGEEVMVFTDVISGSMTQIVSSFLDDMHVKCITGVNLPLILEFILTSERIDDEFIDHAIEEAKQQIVYVNKLLQSNS